MARRLDGPFGAVEASFASRIAQWVAGHNVLDVGCGFGALVANLQKRGFNAVGIDQLEDFIEIGKARYPSADLRVNIGESLPFPDKSFDTVVLKDTIHHIFAENDLPGFLTEVRRVCRQRIIVVDPNPTLVLSISRKIINHIDPVCAPDSAKAALRIAGFRIIHREFHEIIAFPLSGGYVGRRLMPRGLARLVLRIDDFILKILRWCKCERFLCWRYMLIGELA